MRWLLSSRVAPTRRDFEGVLHTVRVAQQPDSISILVLKKCKKPVNVLFINAARWRRPAKIMDRRGLLGQMNWPGISPQNKMLRLSH